MSNPREARAWAHTAISAVQAGEAPFSHAEKAVVQAGSSRKSTNSGFGNALQRLAEVGIAGSTNPAERYMPDPIDGIMEMFGMNDGGWKDAIEDGLLFIHERCGGTRDRIKGADAPVALAGLDIGISMAVADIIRGEDGYKPRQSPERTLSGRALYRISGLEGSEASLIASFLGDRYRSAVVEPGVLASWDFLQTTARAGQTPDSSPS